MIILDPVKDTDVESNITYSLAEKLIEYSAKKGYGSSNFTVTSKSATAPEMPLKSAATNGTPEATIIIDMESDATKNTFLVTATAYSAMVETIVYSLNSMGLKPRNDTGYEISGTLEYGTVSDIKVSLGYESDTTFTDTFVDALAKNLVEESFWPPIKVAKEPEEAGNKDPNMYRFDTWVETTDVNLPDTTGKTLDKDIPSPANSGAINSTTYQSQKLRYLNIVSNVTGNYPKLGDPVDTTDEEGNTTTTYPVEDSDIPWHYTWCTTSTYTKQTDCYFIGSFKCTEPLTLYIAIGNIQKTIELTSTDYTTVCFEVTAEPNALIEVGIQGSGTLNATGIWLTPKANYSDVDDLKSKYSIFPQGYRTDLEKDTTKVALARGVTDADTLIGRIKDVEVVEEETENEYDAIPESNTVSSISSFTSAATTYAAGLSAILSLLSNTSKTEGNLKDLASIGNSAVKEISALATKLTETGDLAEKRAIAQVKNNLEAVVKSAKEGLQRPTEQEKKDEALKTSTLTADERSMREEVNDANDSFDAANIKSKADEAKAIAVKQATDAQQKGIELAKIDVNKVVSSSVSTDALIQAQQSINNIVQSATIQKASSLTAIASKLSGISSISGYVSSIS